MTASSVSSASSRGPQAIFDVLADPSRHPRSTARGSVQSARPDAPERLSLGATFGMGMKVGVPYSISQHRRGVRGGPADRVAALRRHIWRYRLEPADGGTTVTEEFDYRKALSP